MYVMHIALGGCISGGPIAYGATEDTGGHIAYLLGATAAQAARSEIHRISIVTRAFDGPGEETRHGNPYEKIDEKRAIHRLQGTSAEYLEKEALEAELPHLRQALLEMLRKGPRPDVIHAHFADAAELALAARTEFGIPFLYSSHSLGLQKADGGKAHKRRIAQERRAIDGADAIICSSRDEGERQISAYSAAAAGRVHHVSPGVEVSQNPDPQAARDLVTPFLREIDKPIILTIARPVAKKNLDQLVEAYGGSEDLQAAANLVIVAGLREGLATSDTEAARVIQCLFDRVDRADLWGKVALPRSHTPGQVQGLYGLAARDGVFVNPALHEPFGLTVVEALHHGVPTVATCQGGPAEIVSRVGYGEVIDPTDPEGIAAACLKLLNDPDRDRRAAQARAAAMEEYSWARWAGDVTRIMRKLAARTPPSARPRKATRLLLCDLDGTLTDSDSGASEFSDALEARPDMAFALATGRSISEARRVAALWSLPEPEWIISSVGSEIWRRLRRGQYQPVDNYRRRIARGWLRNEIISFLAGAGCSFQPGYDQRPFKVSLFGTEADGKDIERLLSGARLPCRVIPSHGRYVDVLPARAGKAAAADWLANHLGLGPADCVAAGDSGNDRDLLDWAGWSILPANALMEVADLKGSKIYRARATHAEGVVEGIAAFERRGSSLPIAAE